MKPIELIYALGDVDEALIADAAPATKNTTLMTTPVWRFTAVAACFLLAVGLTWMLLPHDGGVVPNLDGTTTTQSTTPSSATTATTDAITTTTTNWEGVGGDGLETYLYAKNRKFAVIPGELIQYFLTTFGRETLNAAIENIGATLHSDPYAFVGDSTHFWVHRFDVPREKFVEINNKAKETYKDSPQRWEEDVFTDEEINDIYTLSTKEFNEKYKAPTAVVVGDLIYDFNWFYKNDIDLWQKQSFTVEQLQDAVANAKATPNFPQGIVEVVEKKLNEYIAAVNA